MLDGTGTTKILPVSVPGSIPMKYVSSAVLGSGPGSVPHHCLL